MQKIGLKQNQIFLILAIVLLSNLFFDCRVKLEPRVDDDPPVEPMEVNLFVEGSIRYYLNANSTNIMSGLLNSNHYVTNAIYKSNTTLHFYNNGLIRNGTLYLAQTIGSTIYQSNSQITYYNNGIVSNATLGNYQYISNANYHSNTDIIFYPNGQIKEGTLNRTNINGVQRVHWINNVPYSSHSGGKINFYSNGIVENAILGNHHFIGDFSYRRGNTIGFYFSGRIKFGFLIGTQIYQTTNVNIEISRSIIWHTNGTLKSASLGGNGSGFMIGLGFYEEASSIFLWDNGQVQQGYLARDLTLTNTTIVRINSWVRFNKDGTYHSHGSSQDTNFNTNL